MVPQSKVPFWESRDRIRNANLAQRDDRDWEIFDEGY
jgi:hypothetical protein